jgi:DNA-binding transcriptional ArsR family regulator
MLARAAIFKALGHPARLAMVAALGSGEQCVCDLQQIVGSEMSTVSKHLTVLRHAGIVDADKRGKQVFYTLRLRCAVEFLHCVDRALKE